VPNSDPQNVKFGPNFGIQPLKGPNFRLIRAAIHQEHRVYMTFAVGNGGVKCNQDSSTVGSALGSGCRSL
jgi:hypothetical protein